MKGYPVPGPVLSTGCPVVNKTDKFSAPVLTAVGHMVGK